MRYQCSENKNSSGRVIRFRTLSLSIIYTFIHFNTSLATRAQDAQYLQLFISIPNSRCNLRQLTWANLFLQVGKSLHPKGSMQFAHAKKFFGCSSMQHSTCSVYLYNLHAQIDVHQLLERLNGL